MGRHDSCQIVVDDPLASRRHAAIDFDGRVAVAQDLGSVNGVLVNGQRLTKPQSITHGDELRLGNVVMHFHQGATESPPAGRWGAETLSAGIPVEPMGQNVEEPTAVRDGEAMETLVAVATKMLTLGRPTDAERIVRAPLEDLARRVRAREAVDRQVMDAAADVAVRLGEAQRSGQWVNYAFALFSEAGLLLPASVIDRLYTAVRVVDGVDVKLVRDYIFALRERQGDLGPAERFLLRRLDGLEQVVIS